MKKCPFKKKYIRTDYNLYGNGFPLGDYQEFFTDCIGDKCAACYTTGFGSDKKCGLLDTYIDDEEEENG